MKEEMRMVSSLAVGDVGDAATAIGDVLPVARQKTPDGDEALWLLADRLEPIDPDSAGPDLTLADAALLLFGEAGFGPDNRALPWLRYAQTATAELLEPSDPRVRETNTAMGSLCERLGRHTEAASAYATVADFLTESGRWREADQFRVKQAQRFYATGHCGDAVALTREVWERWKDDPRGTMVGVDAPLVCAEMLRLCCRRDAARAMWTEIVEWFGSEPWFTFVEGYMRCRSGPVSEGAHAEVCAFREGRR
jgi:hypothetical protein